ncbi:MAG: hypothetical protein JST04_00905 [Bdellovibrionales bacterium]|nr:hypothetical protein [Bdellovibrionales bacterium]
MKHYNEILSLIDDRHIEHIKDNYTDNITVPIKDRIDFLFSRGYKIHSVQNSRGDKYTLGQSVIKHIEKDSVELIDRKIVDFSYDRHGKIIAHVESTIIEKLRLTEIDNPIMFHSDYRNTFQVIIDWIKRKLK